jgi:phage-related protein
VADWVWVESAGSSLEQQPRLKEAQFGDGYAQRAPDGINFMPEVWSLTFDEVEDAVADELVAFLQDQKGYIAFNYVPLRYTTARRVICKRWTRTHTGPGVSSFRATFEQDFAP